jgi:hypothetical protein
MDFADLPERKNPLRFNIAIPSGDIGKLLVLPRFSRSPRERHDFNGLQASCAAGSCFWGVFGE